MKEEFHWTQLLNPEFYINLEIAGHHIGIYVVLFIVFAETGLFAGFFLPGDSLLFLSGIYSETLMRELVYIENEFTNVAVLASLVAISGVIGNIFFLHFYRLRLFYICYDFGCVRRHWHFRRVHMDISV